MKICSVCGQSVAEDIKSCPSCGSEIGEGRRSINGYRIVDILREGYSSLLCHAVREGTDDHVMIRLFAPDSGVNEEVAARLQRELEALKELSHEGLVRHDAIRRTEDGLWYRLSEWIDSETWGSLLASGRMGDMAFALDLFQQTASILSFLHRHGHFIPHLILSDIMATKGEHEQIRIKIDFKLSRFIDPWLDRPSPMLKKLLSSHPDILNERPLDFRSDIWSLGKVFVELLSSDLDTTDYLKNIETLNVPQQLKVLLRVMLADDPDLRPSSMEEIASSLQRIQGELQQRDFPPPGGLPARPAVPARRPKKWAWFPAVVAIAMFFAGALAWLTRETPREDVETMLESYANQYARSLAFLLVEYWLEADGERVYHNVAEGTAFLVDQGGYLLTNRHVACPWLEDPFFESTVRHLRMRRASLAFGHRSFLWMEGERAFNRTGHMIESPDLTDFFFIENAFTTESPPYLGIAGVGKPPMRARQILASPLKDDFAVMKIDRVPPGLTPIPLDLAMEPRKLPKLSRVIALGFPLGSRSQADTVNVSVVRGNVRRTFENMFHIDASLHAGNSGGPVIDARGKAIGIVSAVALDFTQGLVPMATPVWDIGLILPIGNAVELLMEIKGGRAKWNGVLNFSQEKALVKIRETACSGRWAEAMLMADEELSKGLQPALVSAAGMLHFCNAEYEGARLRFSQALSMDTEDNQARLMLVLIDWLSGTSRVEQIRKELLEADWRSTAEFQGYLVRILEGAVTVESASKGWYTSAERSWIFHVSGRLALRETNIDEAERLFQEALLSSDPESWEFLLSRVMLEEVRKERRRLFTTPDRWAEHAGRTERFEGVLGEAMEKKRKLLEALVPLWGRLADGAIHLEEKQRILRKALEYDPENRMILGTLAYYAAAMEEWPEAIEFLARFPQEHGRQNAVWMSLSLLEAQILHYQGLASEAEAALNRACRRLRDPWFLAICAYLHGRQTEDSLRKQAEERPEDTLTGYTALGFWAEGSKDRNTALRFYREALGSFLTDWLEYDFARERIKRLKKGIG